jgi:hypothetical protein
MCKKPHELTAFLEGLFAFERAHLRTQRIYQRDFRVKWQNSIIFSCLKTTLLNYFSCICATAKKYVDSDCHCATFELLVDCSLFLLPRPANKGIRSRLPIEVLVRQSR